MPQELAMMAESLRVSSGRAKGYRTMDNNVFCSIRSSTKAEADEVADGKAHEKEAGGAWTDTILPVPGTEHLVGQVQVNCRYQHTSCCLVSGGRPVAERRIPGRVSGASWFRCALVHGACGRCSAPGPGK